MFLRNKEKQRIVLQADRDSLTLWNVKQKVVMTVNKSIVRRNSICSVVPVP